MQAFAGIGRPSVKIGLLRPRIDSLRLGSRYVPPAAERLKFGPERVVRKMNKSQDLTHRVNQYQEQ